MIERHFRWTHRVSYAECTLGNHVYYARYLDFLERARGEFFREIGHPLMGLQEAGVLFPVIECRLRYKAAARYDDVVQIGVWLSELGRVRLGFAHEIRHEDGRLLVEGETVHACTTLEERPRRLPEDLGRALRPHLHAGTGTDSSSN